MIDLLLPADGEYFVEVDTFSFYIPEFPVYVPDFDVDQYAQNHPDDQAVLDTDTGDYELLAYAFKGVSAAPAATVSDTMVGGLGADTMVGNSGDEVYKITGQLMIKSDKKKIKSELEEKKKLLDTRVNSIERQEGSLTEQLGKLREELMKGMKK